MLSKAIKGRMVCSVVVLLQIINWVSATSRLLPPNDAPNLPHLPAGTISSSFEELKREEGLKKLKEMKRIGSTPPNCESKCYGCSPCVAIQVPTIDGGLNLQYANYLPEGWKCKCGPFFYSP